MIPRSKLQYPRTHRRQAQQEARLAALFWTPENNRVTSAAAPVCCSAEGRPPSPTERTGAAKRSSHFCHRLPELLWPYYYSQYVVWDTWLTVTNNKATPKFYRASSPLYHLHSNKYHCKHKIHWDKHSRTGSIWIHLVVRAQLPGTNNTYLREVVVSHRGTENTLTWSGIKWICTTVLFSSCKPMNSTPGAPYLKG